MVLTGGIKIGFFVSDVLFLSSSNEWGRSHNPGGTPMEQPLDWNTLFLDPILAMAKSVVGFIPNLISALLVFALGYLAALLTRELLRLFLKSLSFDRYSQQIQLLPSGRKAGNRSSPPANTPLAWPIGSSFFPSFSLGSTS
ncbi:MAG: hypothetical protein IPH91_09955 [Elusimicrobia bacterium]|nr:hypothetical protein [Elusimicrobiota bacterium]